MQLNDDEISYIFRLAGHPEPENKLTPPEQLNPALQRMLDFLADVPAYILNRRWDRVAWNSAAIALFGDFTDELNIIRRVFTKSHHYVENWEQIAHIVLAEFQASCAQNPDDPWIAELVDELNATSPIFREWWPKRDILVRREKQTRVIHPKVGVITLEHTSYQVAFDPALTLCIYTPLPADDSPQMLRKAIELHRGEHADLSLR